TDALDAHRALYTLQFEVAGTDGANACIAAHTIDLGVARAHRQQVQRADVVEFDIARTHGGGRQPLDVAGTDSAGADIGAHALRTGQLGSTGPDLELDQDVIRQAASQVQVGVGVANVDIQPLVPAFQRHHQLVANLALAQRE